MVPVAPNLAKHFTSWPDPYSPPQGRLACRFARRYILAMKTVDQLLEEVLALPAPVRSRFARELEQSLEPDGVDLSPAEWAEAWGPELDRRAAELRSGAVKAVPWDQALEELRAEITAG